VAGLEDLDAGGPAAGLKVRVAVIGAGWAGIGAALRLVGAGHRVTLVDAAPAAGGRARGIRASWHGGGDGQPLTFDNGQHLVIGAYTEMLDLMREIGIDEPTLFDRTPFRLDDGIGLRIPASGLGGLLRASGLTWRTRAVLVAVLLRIRADRQRAVARAEGRTVAAWCAESGQTPELLERLWRPLVVSAMNTPVTDACAATFVNVLADSLCAPPAATDFLLPRATLSDAFVDPALAWLHEAGAAVAYGFDVRRIIRANGGYRLDAAGEGARRDVRDQQTIEADGIVLAAPAPVTARILARSVATTATDAAADSAAISKESALLPLIAALRAFRHRSITTVYLGWPDGPADPDRDPWAPLPVMTLLHDRPADGRHGQWLIRRPTQRGWRIGAVVISDSALAATLPREQLAASVGRQLTGQLRLPPARAFAVFHERRATIDCVPDRPRIATTIPGIPRIVLAGDYQYHRYPATLEAALRSGRDAAAQLDRVSRLAAADPASVQMASIA
jgi:squalene-associated FAD-dependent desaturase